MKLIYRYTRRFKKKIPQNLYIVFERFTKTDRKKNKLIIITYI